MNAAERIAVNIRAGTLKALRPRAQVLLYVAAVIDPESTQGLTVGQLEHATGLNRDTIRRGVGDLLSSRRGTWKRGYGRHPGRFYATQS